MPTTLAAAAREFQPDLIYERYNLYLLADLMLKHRLRIPLLLEVNAPLGSSERNISAALDFPGSHDGPRAKRGGGRISSFP